MKKILLLGVAGMLGNTLARYFSKQADCETFGTCRASALIPAGHCAGFRKLYPQVDVAYPEALVPVFADCRPDIVINCIGVIKQHTSASDPITCLTVNSLFPHKLASLCSIAGARLIHISTDCVFSGKRGRYSEADPSDAADLYGKTKSLGELLDYPGALTLRTSIIGHELNSCLSLVDWFLHQTGTVRGYTHAIYTGFPSIEIARILHHYAFPNPSLSGLYQVSSAPISKYELLKLVSQVYGVDIAITPASDVRVDRSLVSERFRSATGYVPPAWPDLIAKMHEDYLEMKREGAHV